MQNKSRGVLYICPTPIGNLKDITYRVMECLNYVDIIACEDTRESKKLLDFLEIDKKTTSYHKFNQEEKGKIIIEKLKEGKNIALITDAGTPTISDPGSYLVADAVKSKIDVTSLPGPSAVITALAATGFRCDNFFFQGFLPRKGPERQIAISRMTTLNCPVVFYESPNRLYKTMEEIAARGTHLNVVIARELTKVYEEYIRGTAKELLEKLKDKKIKGEVTVIVEGGILSEEELTEKEIEELLSKLIENGFTKKEAVKNLAELTGISKKQIYHIAVNCL